MKPRNQPGRWLVSGLVVLGAGGLAFPGCGGDVDPPGEQYCGALCDWFDRCTTPSGYECESNCIQEAWMTVTRTEALELLADCIEEQSCLLDAGAMVGVCWDRLGSTLEPSAQCLRYCDGRVAADIECGFSNSLAACVVVACAWTDSVLDEAASCVEVDDCDRQTECLNAAFSF
jgi:hypothetical protein